MTRITESNPENPVLATLMTHRSVRSFRAEKLTPDDVAQLVAAAQHAPTSTFSQQFSLISVTDPEKLAVISQITGHHWAETAGHYFVILVDQFRNQTMVTAAGASDTVLHSTDKFLAGVLDAAIAAEAMVTAGESMGIGSTIMGSILNDAQAMIDLLNLPSLTFPILGLAMGYPKEQPELKPRLPQSLVHFTNRYEPLSVQEPDFVAYNQLVADYYASRGPNESTQTYVDHMLHEVARDPEARANLAQVIKRQGFEL
ncbi:nitroreductase family protein [Levilactobacillus bambusae]|uniref:NADPH-dependent oxidoreductase n=1 Tax=Levilactobacillus bambusae TaxID=2024736 RepID=A0A2V1MXZ7_9LACO|nr:nitroreductase family protein [Levilactobacillus bambusae]PWF99866.1 NADPH-dependent oxidoreductase [Levilactobacillus bambusae]